jgi:hypothetical protein
MKGVLIFFIIVIAIATIIGIIVWYRRNSKYVQAGESIFGLVRGIISRK